MWNILTNIHAYHLIQIVEYICLSSNIIACLRNSRYEFRGVLLSNFTIFVTFPTSIIFLFHFFLLSLFLYLCHLSFLPSISFSLPLSSFSSTSSFSTSLIFLFFLLSLLNHLFNFSTLPLSFPPSFLPSLLLSSLSHFFLSIHLFCSSQPPSNSLVLIILFLSFSPPTPDQPTTTRPLLVPPPTHTPSWLIFFRTSCSTHFLSIFG